MCCCVLLMTWGRLSAVKNRSEWLREKGSEQEKMVGIGRILV